MAPTFTNSNGQPIPEPFATQRVGQHGPLLLQDFNLIDSLAHFDRERIPERVVHAKGSGAYGVFESLTISLIFVLPNSWTLLVRKLESSPDSLLLVVN